MCVLNNTLSILHEFHLGLLGYSTTLFNLCFLHLYRIIRCLPSPSLSVRYVTERISFLMVDFFGGCNSGQRIGILRQLDLEDESLRIDIEPAGVGVVVCASV